MLNKIYLEPDGLVVGGNQLVTSGGNVGVANNIFIGNNTYANNLIVTGSLIVNGQTQTTTTTTTTTSTTSTTPGPANLPSAPTFSALGTNSYLTGTAPSGFTYYGPMAYDTIEFDTNGCFNNTQSFATMNGINVPPYSFAPNMPGYYRLTCQTASTAAGQGQWGIAFIKNGVSWSGPWSTNWLTTMSGTTSASSMIIPLGTSENLLSHMVTFATDVYLNGTGDYISIGTSQNGGTPAQTTLNCRFSGYQIHS